jgi:NADPH-dependent curcumin reductase CurA
MLRLPTCSKQQDQGTAVAKTVMLTSFIPSGNPEDKHFTIQESVQPTAADLKAGELLLHCLVMSADPYLRSGCKSEAKGGPIPRPMKGFVAGKVLASKLDGWVAGDLFGASLPFCDVQVLKGAPHAVTVQSRVHSPPP